MHLVHIENATFHAFHGVFEEERRLGNKFVVNLRIETDFSRAAKEDYLNGTIDYSKVYEVVKEEMLRPSKLIENVAHRIITSIKRRFSPIHSIEVQIKKCNPPISGEIENVCVTIRE